MHIAPAIWVSRACLISRRLPFTFKNPLFFEISALFIIADSLFRLHHSEAQDSIANEVAAMRYLDWDVLLFPAEEQGAHVPLKEFRTACYSEQYENSQYATPLLTTFVPSLPKGKPFQISLHSWSETGPILTASSVRANATKPRELWQVRVVIDGVCVCTENFPIVANWPQIICMCGLIPCTTNVH